MNTTIDLQSTAVQDILEGLAINLKLSEELLAALHEESAALRAMDTPALFRVSRQKDTLLAKINYLDDSLKKSMADKGSDQGAARGNGAAPAGSKRTEVGQNAEQLRVIGQYKLKINAVRQEIKDRNTINKRFTEDTLGYLSDAINLITRPAQAENTYRYPGRSPARSTNLPSFISREV